MIKLYSTHCPRCRIVEMKLAQKNIEFEMVDDEDTVREVGITNHIMSAPILQVEDEYLDFTNAIAYINGRN